MIKEFKIKLFVEDSGKIITTIVHAKSVYEAKILSKLMFRIDEGKANMIGLPIEVADNKNSDTQ